MSVLTEQAAAASPAQPRRARRPEIDGLRALAAALVVIYHVFTGRVSGGVDVFLALSGFFLVHSLLGQLRRTGRFRPLSSLARTLSRLVPPAVVVLAGTLAASAWVVPETRWREIALHLTSSATFTENLRLVDEAVDYTASNAAASPMQQFWSLSIQVQVLLAAPLVVAAGAAMLWRTPWRRHGRATAVLAVAGVTAGSFLWSIVLTRADQQVAYFSTPPRLWELGVGALVALLLSDARPGPRLGVALGWGGVTALIACGAVLDGAHSFPGWQAAWPVLCAVAVALAADTGGRLGVHRVLGMRPMRWLGERSYALYLWHWPVLVLYLGRSGRDTPSVRGAVAVIMLSVVLAAVTYRLVEQPAAGRLQSRRPALALGLVAVCAAPLLMTGAATTMWLDRVAARVAEAADDPAYPGAAALLGRSVATGGVEGVEPLPSLSVIRDDWPDLPGAVCTVEEEALDPVPAEREVCVLGPDDRERRVVVTGDSHAAQWLPPLAAIAETHSWQVISIVRGGCNLSTESEFIQEGWPQYEECAAWRSRLVDRIIALEPDLVLALGTRTDTLAEEVLPPGFIAAWQQLSKAGLPVIGIRDNPRHPYDTPDCVAQWGDTAPECQLLRSEVYREGLVEAAVNLLPAKVSLLDTSSYFCDETVCPALVGNVRVYQDDHHVTATYMRSIRPLLERDLRALTGW